MRCACPSCTWRADPEHCVGCGKCADACPMSLSVETLAQHGAIADAECIQCAACADVCPIDVLKLQVSRFGGDKENL